MAILRLGLCVAGVYSMFLIWAIAQERLSVPFASTTSSKPEKFKHVLFMNTCQSLAGAFSSLIYLFIRRQKGQSIAETFGVGSQSVKAPANGNGSTNGTANGNGKPHAPRASARTILLQYFQCALLVTSASPFGFAALSHISYPTMVLGKSCKLVPVMIMNVLLYRRRFAPHKYLVVSLVTLGITMFMYFGDSAHGKGASSNASSSVWGLTLLVINLAIDGAINSTQDEIFTRYRVTGQQMMFWINAFSTIVTTVLLFLPLPYIPVLHPSADRLPEMYSTLQYIRTHPSVKVPLGQFALTGSLGQLFIFETLQHFGSLTLVTVTLTRKLFTMILSVVVYNHTLTLGQWSGAAVVFLGIAIEAWVKRKDVHAKRVVQEKEKAKIKDL
ncbi:hypothetical protein BOTBODRAFT_58416 [Botryobasidium botryosum FD-172 SS1]|uniref:UDP-galactose transporter homolog 1 n=1 Tax=Botryobasidium botryosum (strain FD-172 SS1) TaxID=930990 RepID=A0A067ME97_BOTB1|nr:hypothetical protein BOTBODRAFT_58416 [Botryobasidium botryosum FD-172 SS1]